MNNIRIDRSNIGVLNTGHIGSVDNAIGSLRSSGEDAGAEAFRAFTEGLVKLQDVAASEKNKLLDLLSFIASEATVPRQQRRSIAARAVLVEVANICSGVASLTQLYAQFAPAVAAIFT